MNLLKNLLSKLKHDSEMKEDLFKIGTMLAVSKAFQEQSIQGLDNKRFLMETGSTLLGFAVYHLIIKDLAKKINLPDANLQKVAQVAVKVGTVLLVPKLLKGETLDVYRAAYVISGFAANALLKDCFDFTGYFKDPRMKKVAEDFVLAGMTTLVPRIIRGGRITNRSLQEVVAKTLGFAVYDLLLA